MKVKKALKQNFKKSTPTGIDRSDSYSRNVICTAISFGLNWSKISETRLVEYDTFRHFVSICKQEKLILELLFLFLFIYILFTI